MLLNGHSSSIHWVRYGTIRHRVPWSLFVHQHKFKCIIRIMAAYIFFCRSYDYINLYMYICRWYKGNVKINTDDIVSVQKFYKYSKLAAQTNKKRSLTRSNKQMENLLASVQSSSMEENHMDLVGAIMQKNIFSSIFIYNFAM